MIADYSEGGKVEHTKNADNALIFAIDPTDYEAVEETGMLYVRFRNCNTSMGWGARVSLLTIRHLVEADTDAGESTAWLTGKNNTSNINDDAITTPAASDADDSKYLVKTENGTKYYRRRVPTNSTNQDADFLIVNSAESNANYRYCDTTRQLVYLFELDGMTSCELSFNVFQNYLLEVSCDGENWEEFANYYDISGGVHLTTGGNNTTITIDPYDYDCDKTGTCYVRVSNCNTSMGWGGTIISFEMNYTRAAK